jgi:hypothetical protein
MHASSQLRAARTTVGAVAVAFLSTACSESPLPTETSALTRIDGAQANAVFTGRLYAMSGAGASASSLYLVDKNTGAATLIGPTGFNHIVATDFDPMTGILYGIVNGGRFPDTSPELLVTINTSTGAATVVTPITWSTPSACGFEFNNVPDMSFDSNGQLFAWRDPCDDDLYRVNKVSGVATRVGESFVGTAAVGLAFDSQDRLYLKVFGSLFEMNTTTGAATFVGGISLFSQNMLAFDENDVAYTGARGGGSPLIRFNVSDGLATIVGNTNIPTLADLAFERIANQPPVCTNAAASVAELWPPDHRMVDVSVLGVTDPDGDAVSITISGIMQDEPTNGLGDGDTPTDGAGVGTSTASVRAERSGTGDGRVYVISFTASDGKGGSCSGSVSVGVRHNQGGGKKGGPAVNSGATYDSTL